MSKPRKHIKLTDFEPMQRELEDLKRQLAERDAEIAQTKEKYSWVCSALEERNAQCAAMREALEKVSKGHRVSHYDVFNNGGEVTEQILITPETEAAKQALTSSAGLALLTRVRKLEAVAEAARLYMYQPTMSSYATKKDWEADSDIKGQDLIAALLALDSDGGGK